MVKFKKFLSITAAIAVSYALCSSVLAIQDITGEDDDTRDIFSFDDTTEPTGVIVIEPYDTDTSDTEPPQSSDESDTQGTPPNTQETPPDTQETPPDTQETPSDSSEPPPDTASDTSDTSDTSSDVQTEPPLEIFLTNYTFNLEVGQGAQLQWNVPAATEHRNAVYSSGNTNIARINDLGYITAVGAGTTNVTVIWGDLLTATATVYVKEKQVLPEYISIESESFNMKVGETAAIKASISPEEISALYPLSFSSDNNGVAAVDANGIITAAGKGETDITVFSEAANLKKLVHVTVSEEITYNKAKLDGYLYGKDGNPLAGSTLFIDSISAITDKNGHFTFDQMDCRDMIIRLSDNQNAFCGLSLTGDLTVYLLYTGTGISQVYSYEELAQQFSINNVSFVSPVLVMTVGEVYELAYSYEPKDASVTAIEYVSSNAMVAPVGQIDGVVTARSPGEAIITLSLNGGQTMTTCTITINPMESSEHSVLIAAVETAVLVIAVIAFFAVYRVYRKKLERNLMDEEEESNGGDLHDID